MVVDCAGKGSCVARDRSIGFRHDLDVIIHLLGRAHGLLYASRIWSALIRYILTLVVMDLELKNFADRRLCRHRSAHQLMSGLFVGIARLLGFDNICIYV